ncbi:MAG: hypothetical protein NZ898_16995 [Myxococcota bacterium]|nr:hypothetical protein [Myxococcota bacterium]
MSIATFATLLVGLTGCGREPERRLASPEATLATLLDSYGLRDASEHEVRRRLQRRERFTLVDAETFRACFADHAGPVDEGAAGWLFGRLVARKDGWRLEPDGADVVHVTVEEPNGRARLATLVRDRRGQWKLSLARSVPPEVRARLRVLYERVRASHARLGAPSDPT